MKKVRLESIFPAFICFFKCSDTVGLVNGRAFLPIKLIFKGSVLEDIKEEDQSMLKVVCTITDEECRWGVHLSYLGFEPGWINHLSPRCMAIETPDL